MGTGPAGFDRPGGETLPGWVAALPARPTVCCTLGTFANDRDRLFAAIIAELRDEAQCFGDAGGLGVAALFDFVHAPPGGPATPAISRVTVLLVPGEGHWLAVHAHWSTPRPRAGQP